ncbi:hypothetical protein ABT288_40000 [Streptomyces sp. NPDC001093]|uniref:hypothetical protein n=1 Tax=Streptomyces sp. NPDC001093 TaxID=3154376 RepID=UPI003324548C
MATATLVGPTPEHVLDGTLLGSLLWAVAEERHGLEHVSVAARPGRTDVVLFYTGNSPCAADAAGADLCRRALWAASQLHGWRLGPGPH